MKPLLLIEDAKMKQKEEIEFSMPEKDYLVLIRNLLKSKCQSEEQDKMPSICRSWPTNRQCCRTVSWHYHPKEIWKKFQGEDVMDEKRRELQRKQQKAWLDQQMKEKAIAESVRRNEEMSQEGTALLLDRKAVELDIAEQEARRLQKEALAEFNKALMAEKDACHRERERLELLDKQAEMTNCITGDFLTENPDVAASAFGPHRLIPDRWKGMSLEKRQQIRKEQLQQALEEKKRREDEKRRNTDWQCRINELDRCAILFERELMKKRREQNKALLNQNQMLSQEQRARNEHLNKFVYSNTPTEEYFKQFNTSTR